MRGRRWPVRAAGAQDKWKHGRWRRRLRGKEEEEETQGVSYSSNGESKQAAAGFNSTMGKLE